MRVNVPTGTLPIIAVAVTGVEYCPWGPKTPASATCIEADPGGVGGRQSRRDARRAAR